MFSLMKPTVAAALLIATSPVHADPTHITASFEGLLLSEAAQKIGTQADLTFGFPPELGKRIGPNVKMTSVPADIAVEIFAAAYQVCLVRTPQVIHIRPCDIEPRG
jgi:hypothetical protein